MPSSKEATIMPHGSEGAATCIACGVGVSSPPFSSAAEQRQHFKTDWHRSADDLTAFISSLSRSAPSSFHSAGSTCVDGCTANRQQARSSSMA